MIGLLAAYALGRRRRAQEAEEELEEYFEELEARGLMYYQNGEWYYTY